jgi:hypothetical protein
VPVLREGHCVLWASHTIFRYLATPGGTDLLPATGAAAAGPDFTRAEILRGLADDADGAAEFPRHRRLPGPARAVGGQAHGANGIS